MTAWKDLERRICRALGGERRGPLGRQCSDCTPNVPYAVETKRSKRQSIQSAWITQAKAHGRKEKKPWLVVVCGHNSPRPIVVMDFWHFAELAQRAGEIPTPLLVPEPCETVEEGTA
jgi:hypothetical protein